MKNYQLLLIIAILLLPFAYYTEDVYLCGIGMGIGISGIIINPIFKLKK